MISHATKTTLTAKWSRSTFDATAPRGLSGSREESSLITFHYSYKYILGGISILLAINVRDVRVVNTISAREKVLRQSSHANVLSRLRLEKSRIELS